MQRAQSLELLRSLWHGAAGNVLPVSPPFLSKGKPNCECTVYYEIPVSYCRIVFPAFSYLDCTSSFYFQWPHTYLEDAVYLLPLKLIGPKSWCFFKHTYFLKLTIYIFLIFFIIKGWSIQNDLTPISAVVITCFLLPLMLYHALVALAATQENTVRVLKP